MIDLTPFLDQRYGTLSGAKSGGQISRALIFSPAIRFLDEPTVGLDPASREPVWGAIANLRNESSLTVFLTTHFMEETEQSDNVCVMDAGAIVAEGTPTAFRARYAQDELRLSVTRIADIRQELVSGGYHVDQEAETLQLKVASSVDAMTLLKRYEGDITDFEFRHGTMDDVFLSLIGPTVAKGATS